jgi:hypothetical protein
LLHTFAGQEKEQRERESFSFSARLIVCGKEIESRKKRGFSLLVVPHSCWPNKTRENGRENCWTIKERRRRSHLNPADQENHLEEDRALCYLEEENQGKKKSLLKEDRLLH